MYPHRHLLMGFAIDRRSDHWPLLETNQCFDGKLCEAAGNLHKNTIPKFHWCNRVVSSSEAVGFKWVANKKNKPFPQKYLLWDRDEKGGRQYGNLEFLNLNVIRSLHHSRVANPPLTFHFVIHLRTWADTFIRDADAALWSQTCRRQQKSLQVFLPSQVLVPNSFA